VWLSWPPGWFLLVSSSAESEVDSTEIQQVDWQLAVVSMDHTSNQPQPSERAADMQPSHTHHQPFTSGQHSSTSHSFPHVSEPAASDDVDLYERRHQPYDDVTIPKQVVDTRDEAGAVATPSSKFPDKTGDKSFVFRNNNNNNNNIVSLYSAVSRQ